MNKKSMLMGLYVLALVTIVASVMSCAKAGGSDSKVDHEGQSVVDTTGIDTLTSQELATYTTVYDGSEGRREAIASVMGRLLPVLREKRDSVHYNFAALTLKVNSAKREVSVEEAVVIKPADMGLWGMVFVGLTLSDSALEYLVPDSSAIGNQPKDVVSLLLLHKGKPQQELKLTAEVPLDKDDTALKLCSQFIEECVAQNGKDGVCRVAVLMR